MQRKDLTSNFKKIVEDYDKTVGYLIFGIIYASDLENYTVSELGQISKEVTGTESPKHRIRDGINLSKYVNLK
ncbi:MAG: hypothetical protein LBM13_03135 [Candidatus Ancillula sp.]|jgi:hypothetical protein|nr:hypothetical protein [Candidatus Ancillula sp.]